MIESWREREYGKGRKKYVKGTENDERVVMTPMCSKFYSILLQCMHIKRTYFFILRCVCLPGVSE